MGGETRRGSVDAVAGGETAGSTRRDRRFRRLLRKSRPSHVHSKLAQGATGRGLRTSPSEELMIGFIIAGLVIGALARLIKPGKQHLSVWMTLLLGLAGSVVGGVVANLLGTGSIWELNVLGFVVAVIAAVALIGLAEGASRSKASTTA